MLGRVLVSARQSAKIALFVKLHLALKRIQLSLEYSLEEYMRVGVLVAVRYAELERQRRDAEVQVQTE